MRQNENPEPVFTGDAADRHQAADFCLEIAGWLFVNGDVFCK